MSGSRTVALVVTVALGAVASAQAQRLPFERVFEVRDASVLDVSTIRGQIDITAGEPGRIIVGGAVTVGVGWNVPADAPDLARQAADRPPIAREADTVRYRREWPARSPRDEKRRHSHATESGARA